MTINLEAIERRSLYTVDAQDFIECRLAVKVCREDVPALVARVRELEAERDRIRDYLSDCDTEDGGDPVGRLIKMTNCFGAMMAALASNSVKSESELRRIRDYFEDCDCDPPEDLIGAIIESARDFGQLYAKHASNLAEVDKILESEFGEFYLSAPADLAMGKIRSILRGRK